MWEGTWKSHTRLPRECAQFAGQTVYEKPSHLLSDLTQNLPPREALDEDQKLFFLRFGVILDKVLFEDCVGVLLLRIVITQAAIRSWTCIMSCQEQTKEPGQRGVYHTLLLGQSSSGRTYVAQKVIFPIALGGWAKIFTGGGSHETAN